MTTLAARLRHVPTWQVTLGGALLVLGFLIVAQLRAEPQRVRYTSQERPPLVETAQNLQKQQDQLKSQILDLRGQIEQVESSQAGNDALVATVNDALTQARLEAGLVGLEGPGMVIQLEDSTQPVPPDAAAGDYLVSSSDLRDVVNELWLDGAEAIAINGERVVATSGLTDVGSSILLNGAYLQPPYQVVAIGPSDLYQRLTTSASFRAFSQARIEGFGIRFGIGPLDKAVVPPYAGGINILYANPMPSPTPAPVATAVPPR